MSDETSGGGTGGKLPEAESLVPGGRESVCTVRGDDLYKSQLSMLQFSRRSRVCTYTVGNDVGVTVEGSLWVTVRALVAGQVPDDQGLVAGSRQKHVWVLEGGCEGGNPSAVALEGAF